MLVIAVLIIAVIDWFTERDERRVAGACETWLNHRDGLRTVISESEEAIGRAEASGHQDVGKDYNYLDATIASLDEWAAVGPATLDELQSGSDASSLEEDAEWAFEAVNEGVIRLRQLIDEGDPIWLADYLSEARARFQHVDDICGFAWRSQ